MTVATEVADGLAHVRFGPGKRANPLTEQTRAELREELAQLAEAPDVRAVVLQGRGGHFCAGQDLAEHAERLKAGPEAIGAMVRDEFSPIVTTLVEMPKPIVALLEGAVAGAGLGLALACDLRVASDTARLGTAFADVALGADSGVSWLLPRLVGHARAADLLMRPRFIDGREAASMGLVHDVVAADELIEHGRIVGSRLAQGPTIAYAAIKSTLASGDAKGLSAALAAESDWQAVAAGTLDHRAAVKAFLAKEVPTFRGE